MSEKRFHMNFDKYAHQIMCDGDGLSLQETVKILNEQQDKISELGEELEESSAFIIEQRKEIKTLKEENSNLNSILNEVGLQKPFIKILDDYMIEYDGSCFSMHKPSDIRSFVYLMNRNNNFDELQCEYNDESMVIDDE